MMRRQEGAPRCPPLRAAHLSTATADKSMYVTSWAEYVPMLSAFMVGREAAMKKGPVYRRIAGRPLDHSHCSGILGENMVS